jgi:nitronate monooxygenase
MENDWNRREFFKLGAAATAIVSMGCSARAAGPARAMPLHTPVCKLLGIDHAILQSGMAPIGGPELAAAVSAAGGLGILGAAHLPADEVRRRIREVRRRTDRPFGVNLLLHEQVSPPVDAATFGDATVNAIHNVLNRMRVRLGLSPRTDRPPTRPNHVPAVIDVMLEERVPVFSVGLGNPPREIVDRFHAQGGKVIAMVTTPDDARSVVANGVDVVVAQGSDAGGHRSNWRKPPSVQHSAIGTMSLIPAVVRAVDVPVIAAGGIADGRGVVAALALGAQGVMVGTRFVATQESLARDFYKNELIKAGSDDTVITDSYTGLYARLLRNSYIAEYDASGAPTLPGYAQLGVNNDILARALSREDREFYPLWAGQGVGLVTDVRPAAEVMQLLMHEADDAIRGLGALR